MTACCVCRAEFRGPDDVEGFLCSTHWLRVSAATREKYRKSVKAYYRAKSKGGVYRAHAWGEMADAMAACKDEAKLSLGLEDPAPWGTEDRRGVSARGRYGVER